LGFGALIGTGSRNELLRGELLACVTEVRIEQSLEEPTRFAIRFQEDIRDGEPLVMGAAELQPEQILTVVVPDGDELRCLTRGPITEVRCSVAIGGPGSWVELHGVDRRVELDRQCFRHVWEGRASDAATTILRGYDFEVDVEATTRNYSHSVGTLNQRATDLAFLRRLARQNNLSFWLDYECRLAGTPPLGGSLTVREIARFKSSPARPEGPSPPVSVADIPLVPSVDVALRVNVAPDRCQTVTAFQMDVDVERPNGFEGSAINDRDGRESRTSADDRQPALASGERLRDVTGRNRSVCITSPGDAEELQPRAEALLTDAGWFVHATASTTAHMLGAVLVPHDVVPVEGLDRRHSGPYQVAGATHVINAADHFMDLELRSNYLGAA
jgi:phage protein D